MIISCPECRSRFRVDSSALGVEGRTAHCDKSAYTWLQVLPGREAEIVPEEGTDPALANGVVPSANIESARDVAKSRRFQLLDKDQQELQARTFNSPARRLLPEQSVPYKVEIKDPTKMRDFLLISFAEKMK